MTLHFNPIPHPEHAQETAKVKTPIYQKETSGRTKLREVSPPSLSARV